MRRQSNPELVPANFSRRLFLKAGAAAMAGIVVGDMISSSTLSSKTTHYSRKGTGSGTLSVGIPGFLAPDVRKQTSPFHPVWDEYGDSVMVQSVGELYNEADIAQYTAEQIAERLKTRRYGRLVMNGVSMGGNVSADALHLLHHNGTLQEYSTEATAIMFDTPSSANDLAKHLQRLDILAQYPAGRITNILPKLNGMDESLALSQARSLSDRISPESLSLNYIQQLVYWQSLQGGDMVRANSAVSQWQASIAKEKFSKVEVDIEHVAFEANPELSRACLADVYASI